MDGDVFVLADMTVEVHRPRTAAASTVIGFNGTTEWALDSVDQTDAVWLPAEDQLRDPAGRRVPTPRPRPGRRLGVVHVSRRRGAGRTGRHPADDPANALRDRRC